MLFSENEEHTSFIKVNIRGYPMCKSNRRKINVRLHKTRNGPKSEYEKKNWQFNTIYPKLAIKQWSSRYIPKTHINLQYM